MKRPIKILFCMLLIAVSTQHSVSQSETITEHTSSEQGISSNLIYCMMQDSKGFLWFGTMFGLVRFDGREYKTYRNDPSDTNSLSNDDIISLCEDNENNIWAGTYNGGLNKYDRRTGEFTRYINKKENSGSISANTVWAVFQDSRGIIWAGTDDGGLNRFENGKFTYYKSDSLKTGSISGNNIRNITEDTDGNLWIGTLGKGLNKFDRKKEEFINYMYDSLDVNSLSGNTVNSVFRDSDGNIWAGTGKGLNRFDKEKNTFIRYQKDSLNPFSISSSFILSISEYDKNYLLAGTGNGLNKMEKSSGKFSKIVIYPDKPELRQSILTLLRDKSGVIWAGIYYEGLHKIYESNGNFKNILTASNVKSICEYRDGTFLTGTVTGIEITDITGNKTDNLYVFKNGINSIAKDKSGKVWAGSSKGLLRYDTDKKIPEEFHHDPENEKSVSSDNILVVYTDKSGVLWAGTDNGLCRYNESTGEFVNYKNIPGDESSLSENTVLSVFEDSKNSIWAGTYKGLNKLDKETGTFMHYKQDPTNPNSISNNYVFSFCEDKSGKLWIGTGGGLNLFESSKETFIHFTEKDGLPNGVISGIAEDKNGNLWISTYKGISKFNPSDKSFRNFDTDEGIKSNMFNSGSYIKTSGGKILFGSINGIEVIDPEYFRENNFHPDVILTSFTKYNGKDKTRKDISPGETVDLKYNENIISIKFASNDFANPHKSRFRYMLDGFDTEWIDNGNSNEAVYTNLDPGNYTFRVKTSEAGGIWNSKETVLNINIKPPFWKTGLFYLFTAAAILTALILMQNFRVRKKVSKLIEIEKIKEKERELMREQASRDYHDELGHKLTRISLYSRRINKKIRPDALAFQKDLESIVETSNSLQSGAKDLIWALNPKEDSFYDFAVRLRDFGNELFESTGISFNAYGISGELKEVNLSMNSKRHLIYIFKEGMNNILKYAGCTNVNLAFNFYGSDLEILLEDDGMGFDISNCSKGYGLKNIFSRSKQININVNITSEVNRGTKIVLKTSVKNLVSA